MVLGMELTGLFTSSYFLIFIFIFGLLLKGLGSVLCCDYYSSCVIFFSGMCKTISFLLIAWAVIVGLFSVKTNVIRIHVNTKQQLRTVATNELFAVEDSNKKKRREDDNVIRETVKYIIDLSDEEVDCLELFDVG